MEEPLTEDLLCELLESGDPASFLKEHDLSNRSLSDYLQDLLAIHKRERVEVIRAAEINETYGYQLFAGQRKNPSRNILLQLAFGMGVSLQEANRLLKTAGLSPLYCKSRRDAIIIFCLNRGCTLQTVNEELFRFKEDTVS